MLQRCQWWVQWRSRIIPKPSSFANCYRSFHCIGMCLWNMICFKMFLTWFCIVSVFNCSFNWSSFLSEQFSLHASYNDTKYVFSSPRWSMLRIFGSNLTCLLLRTARTWYICCWWWNFTQLTTVNGEPVIHRKRLQNKYWRRSLTIEIVGCWFARRTIAWKSFKWL